MTVAEEAFLQRVLSSVNFHGVLADILKLTHSLDKNLVFLEQDSVLCIKRRTGSTAFPLQAVSLLS